MKISSVGAELFRENGRTDGQIDIKTKLIVAFRSFTKAPKTHVLLSGETSTLYSIINRIYIIVQSDTTFH
jgi:hypothetical protein